ncbi:hypothetical protein CL629_00475 [bacterium]|nr:hypothetical protein [bacterium]|tara:strand:- start:13698 stop:14846 length:1149 start_codon:yes stop_codon:yes gene_type:complete
MSSEGRPEGTPYVLFLDRVRKEGGLVSHAWLQRIRPDDRKKELLELLRETIREAKDADALQLLEWFIQASLERAIYPHLREEDGEMPFRGEGTPFRLDNEATETAEDIAWEPLTRYLLQLLFDAPGTREVAIQQASESGCSDSERPNRTTRVVALPKTRTRLLELVTERWRNTEDGEEAVGIFFDHILSFPTLQGLDRSVWLGAIRTATRQGFPVPRLAEHHQIIADQEKCDKDNEEIACILAIAWARNQSVHEFAQGLRITSPLAGRSTLAFQVATATTERVAAFDRAIRTLKDLLRDSILSVSELANVGSELVVEVGYTEPGTANVTVTINLELTENTFGKALQAAERAIRSWREADPKRRLRASLRLTASPDHEFNKTV